MNISTNGASGTYRIGRGERWWWALTAEVNGVYFFVGLALLGALLPGANASEGAKAPTITSNPATEAIDLKYRLSSFYADKNRAFNIATGGIAGTKNGRIWALWGSGGDDENAYMLLATVENGSKPWPAPVLAIDPHRRKEEAQGAVKCRALVGNLWVDPQGRLWLFYDQSLGYFDGRAGVWASMVKDPAAARPTWSKPRRIFEGALHSKPMVLSSGEWLLFSTLWTRDKINPDRFSQSFRELDIKRGINIYSSTDQGESWKHRSTKIVPNSDFDEPIAVELADGRLWLLSRTNAGWVESFSSDKGVTWTAASTARIRQCNSRLFLTRLASGRLLLIKNGEIDEQTVGRSKLMAFLSADDGASWEGGLMLDERGEKSDLQSGQKNSGVSYPDGFQASDGSIYVLYDYNRGSDAEILMCRFSESDILARSWLTPGSRQKIRVNKAMRQ